MNQVKLSGILASDVALRTIGSHRQIATASLSFSRSSDPVFLIAVDARVRQLTEFRRGDPVAITGRLVVYPRTQKFVILLDVAGRWKMATNRPAFDYDTNLADKTMREIEPASEAL